jgi:hypothetical protein
MSNPYNIAVVLLCHDTALPAPALQDVRTYLLSGRFSIARFWRDSTYGWVTFPRFDFFGWYNVVLPPPPSSRSATVATAKDCLREANVALDNYDGFFVIRFPGTDRAGQGYDSGAVGNAAAINSFDSHLFAAHEFGHILGFNHSYGILTLGGDQDGDGIDEPGPVYGDPYCIMSAATFGGADPSVDLRTKFQQKELIGLPNAWRSGPPPSRALVHFQMPLAAEMAAKVTHMREWADDRYERLYVAGDDGQGAELIVYHPTFEEPNGMGRVYVEYRQPENGVEGTRWDAGLERTGTGRDRAGIVIHVVRPEPVSGAPVVWYAGHIILPTPDLDITVDTPTGPVRVSIDILSATAGMPRAVHVKVNREQGRSINFIVTSDETRIVVASEQRSHPSWPFMKFTWETREVTRTTRYRPFVAGLGGAGTFQGSSQIVTRWSVGGVELPSAQGSIDVVLPSSEKTVRIRYSINAESRELSLSNRPSDGPYTVPVVCTATAPDDVGPVAGISSYSAPAVEEGWGDDYYHFLDWWHDLIHPIPIEIPGPPRWWIEERFNRAAQQVKIIEQINPELAVTLKEVMAEEVMAEVGRVNLHHGKLRLTAGIG